MSARTDRGFGTIRELATRHVLGPIGLALTPAISLVAFWLGGERALLGAALCLPILVLAIHRHLFAPTATLALDPVSGLPLRDAFELWAKDAMVRDNPEAFQLAVLVLSIDDLDALESRLGRHVRDSVVADAAVRMRDMLRRGDMIANLSPNCIAVGLARVRPPETETVLQLARRLQSGFEEPFRDVGVRVYRSVSVGGAIGRQVLGKGDLGVLDAAIEAHEIARKTGPGTIRMYSPGLAHKRTPHSDLDSEIGPALENGEVVAWFQPQISTDSGDITGFEALARWHHPSRGIISPMTFLPLIERGCLTQRLTEIILDQSLGALNLWDKAGLEIPTVAVNFSGEDLRNPRLADFIRWELDRHDLPPSRLTVEVLENVIAEAREDAISKTLGALAGLGCRIDLDDFGTGHTSILNIRRFSVARLKIDRSLISRVDSDPDQRDMVAAVLSLSERLRIETLAEGVETTGEHAMLAQLGCGYVQGFAIARPLPLADTFAWVDAHRAHLSANQPKAMHTSGDRAAG